MTTTYVESSLGKDLKVTVTEDTVEVIFLATGNATLYGPDGSVLGRNPGQVRFRVVFDAQTGKELSFELIFGSTGRSDDFCEVEVPLLRG